MKGRILGIADREIDIKTAWDPATYNVGDAANEKTPWREDHVGEVWWDLSTVKWLWYEQDTQEYKHNHWGQTFPGSSIDIYEWTESSLLPSEWNRRVEGSTQTISGTALYDDDSNYTVVQKYDSKLDTFVPRYYYWVKNKTTLPPLTTSNTRHQHRHRKNTTAYISNLITNPRLSSTKYYAVTDTNKFQIFNVNNLYKDAVVLNVDFRKNTFEGDNHSVWKLAREGDKNWRPNSEIETRWWDSLIGKNTSGDLVPDTTLPVNERYGANVRPRQSWYVDRKSALKEIIDYTNSVLLKNQMVGQFSLTNLDSKEAEPTAQSLTWDASVDTYAELTYVNTADLSGSVN